jgi:tetratricopeptide (TPR) repeat protein
VCDRHYARGWQHLAKEEKEAGLGEFSAAVSSEAAIRQLWNNCGSALAEHGMADLAVAFYEGALGADRDQDSSRSNLAASNSNLGHCAQARTMREEFLKESPRDRTSLLLLAATYEKEARYQEAVNVFSEVARLYPDDAAPWVVGCNETLSGIGQPFS